MINDLDDSYVYTFYSVSNDKSVEEFVKGLGYINFNESLKKNKHCLFFFIHPLLLI